MEKSKVNHFVLVHGACHGAWCWYKVATILKGEGHKVSVLDMAACGINTKTAEEVKSMAEYNQPLIEFMASLPQQERVVLYNQQVVSHMDTEFKFSNGTEKDPISMLFGPKLLAANFYQLSPAEDLTLATYLVRPVPTLFDDSHDKALTNEKYGSVCRVYVVCDKDNVLKEEQFQRWLIHNNPPDGVEMILDADHMVMFSKPKELCSCLVMISQKYH